MSESKGPRGGRSGSRGGGRHGPRQGTYLGPAGETAAAGHLEGQGYQIVERNYRCRLGEVDIIARDGEILCFVEVKARRQGAFGGGLEAVGARKRAQVRRLATYYLGRFGDHPPVCRFDAVEVLIDRDGRAEKVNLVRNAF